MRGSEESLLFAGSSNAMRPAAGGCKICNEGGVDGRDFLNLTVDEMMHIRQVNKIGVSSNSYLLLLHIFWLS